MLAVRALDGGLRPFMHGVEWHEMKHLVAFQGLVIFHATQNGQVDGIIIVRARCQCAVENYLLDGYIVHAERVTQRQLVLGQGSSLVRTQHVHTGQFLNGHQFAYNRLLFGQQACADRHGYG